MTSTRTSAAAGTQPAAAPPAADVCTASRRDDRGHAWHFDGDDPYIVCAWCGELRAALDGRVIRPAAEVTYAQDALRRTRSGRVVHRSSCHNARRGVPWEWAAGKTPAAVTKAASEVGLTICAHCDPLSAKATTP